MVKCRVYAELGTLETQESNEVMPTMFRFDASGE